MTHARRVHSSPGALMAFAKLAEGKSAKVFTAFAISAFQRYFLE
jgi:hypothetical protein